MPETLAASGKYESVVLGERVGDLAVPQLAEITGLDVLGQVRDQMLTLSPVLHVLHGTVDVEIHFGLDHLQRLQCEKKILRLHDAADEDEPGPLTALDDLH